MKEEKIELTGLRFSSNRAYGGEGDIQILAEDIKRNGIINPVTVKAIREKDAGQLQIYEVIAGQSAEAAMLKCPKVLGDQNGGKHESSRCHRSEQIHHR
jgi:hypothetical protein